MHNESGQTLVELIVVIAVGIIIAVSLTFAAVSTIRNNQFAKSSIQATKLAQEALEQVKIGRDRNACILPINTLGSVNSWNGNSTDGRCPGSGKIWDYQLNSDCPPTCFNSWFFTVDSDGVINVKGNGSGIPPTIQPVNGFTTAIMLTDTTSSVGNEKTATAIVKWSDFSGTHQSTLKTILRNQTL